MSDATSTTATAAAESAPTTAGGSVHDSLSLLSPDVLAVLGSLVPGERSALSPLRAGAMPSAEEVASLRAAGVLTGDDALTAEWTRRLSILAESRAATRLRVRSGPGFECTVWFAPDGGEPVSVSCGAAGISIDDPAPLADLLAGLERLGGTVSSPSLRFAAELGAREAVVLAALLDQHRSAVLRALAAGGAEETGPVGHDGLVAATAGETGLLVGAVREAWSEPLDLDARAVHAACESLAAAGHVTAVEGGVALAGGGRDLAARFLLVDHVVDLLALREIPDGTVARVGATLLQSGPRDVLAVERVGDAVRFEVVSPLDVVEWAAVLLGDPDALVAEGPANVVPEPAAPANVVPEPAAPATVPQPAGEWRPTHTVPAGGLPAWSAPDPSAAPAATLDPGLPVQVVETAGAWSRVVCSNGWTAWVDGRLLT